MILKSPNSRLSIVNLLADFILNKIPKEEESIIQVVDCSNFYVIKGKTTYNSPLDIATIKDEFITKHQSLLGEIKLSHTIDLIEYESKITKIKSSVFTYHDNCIITVNIYFIISPLFTTKTLSPFICQLRKVLMVTKCFISSTINSKKNV